MPENGRCITGHNKRSDKYGKCITGHMIENGRCITGLDNNLTNQKMMEHV